MTTSSAVPGWLLRYGERAMQLDDHLARSARHASEALQAFASTWPDVGYPPHDPAADAHDHALRNREVDAWVGRIGQAFRRADLASGGGWSCRIPPEPVVIDDRLLVSAGFATNEQAARAGTALADTITHAINHDYGDIEPETIERWRDTMRAHQHDAAYTAAFYNRLGATNALWLAKTIEDHYPHDEFGDPRWGLAALRPFSTALATAMTARHEATIRDTFRLRQRFVDEIVVPPTGWDHDEPEEHHLGLLFREGEFPTGVLLALGRNVVDRHLGSTFRAGPFAVNAWGPADDPVANVLGAIAKNADASLAFLAEDGNRRLRPFLERWANDLDGDGGQNAARVLEQAVTQQQGGDMFRDAVDITADLGEIRNWFNHEALAAGTAANIDAVTTTAVTLGDHDRLIEMHDFLTTLLADTDAAARVYDAAVRHTYDVLAQAGTDDTLGSELGDIGALLGLVLTADAHADLRDAEERIARRDALLDGITQITDLALTFTAGRWVPFAKTGRNALIDSFRDTHELDDALNDIDAFENELRLRLSIVIAVRMVQTGDLAPPPGGLPATPVAGDEAELERLAAWVNSPEVRDVIGPDRADAGQYMDEVERLLPAVD